jgi:hypothetical protein
VARAISRIIFENQRVFLKIHGPRLDFTEGQGLTAKLVGIFRRGIIFQWENTAHSIQHPWTAEGTGPQWTGHGRAKGLTGAHPSNRSEARWLIGGGATERGVYGESISGLTGAWVATWRPGDGGEEVAVEALGASGAWAWREEKKSGERCGGERRASPFI